MSELLPCPFCGGEAELEKSSSGSFTVGCSDWENCIGFWTSCNYFKTEAEAIAAWNNRVDYHGYEQAALEAWKNIKAWNSRAERTIEDVMAEYEELAANQNVKDYFEVSKELRTIQSEQFRDEPELELYKEVNGCRFYIELPYDELWIMTDKVEVKHHSYSYRYERPNGNTVMSCSSLCGYPREWAIEKLDEVIEELRELMGGDAE